MELRLAFVLALTLLSVLPGAAAAGAPPYLFQWGTAGTGNGQFNRPMGVVVAPSGVVYVSDYDNHRIQVFASDGTYLTQWGAQGEGPGQFYHPGHIALDHQGNVYVAEENCRVQKFTSEGAYITSFGTPGSGDGEFDTPNGIAVSHIVYVADQNNHRVEMFTLDGTYIGQWGTLGDGDGQFASTGPGDIAVSVLGVYVVDPGHGRIQLFDSSGWYWGQRAGVFGGIAVMSLCGDCIDPTDYMYVTGRGSVRLEGAFIEWGTYGSGEGQFNMPHDVAVDANGTIYVADTYNHRIQVFGCPVGCPVTPAKTATWGSVKALYR